MINVEGVAIRQMLVTVLRPESGESTHEKVGYLTEAFSEFFVSRPEGLSNLIIMDISGLDVLSSTLLGLIGSSSRDSNFSGMIAICGASRDVAKRLDSFGITGEGSRVRLCDSLAEAAGMAVA